MQEPSQNEIARRAHEIWEREGRPEGRSTEHWLAAEKELRASEPHAAAEPPPERKAPAPRRGKRLELVS